MTLDNYTAGEGQIPKTMPAWQVFGKGLENFGVDGQPSHIPVYEVAPDQLLARVDAAGLCFSDIKILTLGGDHPRLYNRDLKNDPIVMGHEAAITIVKVGENHQGQYNVGDRFVVQAEAYYKGKNLAFGYMLPGALQPYTIIGPELLEGDDGCYLIPVQADTGYSEAALSEPWACVVCAYRMGPRRSLEQSGIAWVIGTPGSEAVSYSIGALEYSTALPRKIYLTDVPDAVATMVKNVCMGAGISVEETAALDCLDLDATFGDHGADDVFILGGGSPEALETGSSRLARRGLLNLITSEPLSRRVDLDVGRIHYDGTFCQGGAGPDVSRGYQATRGPQLTPGGKAWMLGGAGPMGQMHVQLAIEMKDGPSLIVASDIDGERLDSLARSFAGAVKQNDKELICLNPLEMGDDAFSARLHEIAPEGFDDVVVLVPATALIEQGAEYLADNGWLNIFAGVARGTMAQLDASDIALRNVRYVGTSGSSIDDLRKTLTMTESRELSTNRSVAAVGGIEAAHDGLSGVKAARFTGKVIIYPQITGLPLTAIEDLSSTLPGVADKLSPDGAWTREAERALIEHFLP